MNQKLVIVRGAGDIATGALYALHHFGYKVVATELARPSSIRRTVSLCEAVYDGTYAVEDVAAVRCTQPLQVHPILATGKIPVLIDPEGASIQTLKPDIVVDAMLAKRNLGTTIHMAPVVIGVGPGFYAGRDVHAVVETKRGHDLGRVILNGTAVPNTGIPGNIGGYTTERVIYSPCAGIIKHIKQIGDHVEAGEPIATVEGTPVIPKIGGVLRGLIRDGFPVAERFKIADVDPRDLREYCFTISDKARLVGFGVLMAIQMLSK